METPVRGRLFLCRMAATRSRRVPLRAVIALAALPLLAACDPDPAEPLEPGQLAFGVFGDGPYSRFDQGPYRRLLDDVADADIAFLVHVGDITGSDCSDAVLTERFRQIDSLPFPVIYTPGDNEWTDCHEPARSGAGPWDTLDRLDALRRTFFPRPGRSLGRDPLPLVSQAGFPENARGSVGPVVVATLHLVGSENGRAPFPGRTAAHDAEVEGRTRAAAAWIDATFDAARHDSARLVVLGMHSSLWDDWPDGTQRPRAAYDSLGYQLARRVVDFPGQVLAVHGDWHEYRVDRPGRDPSVPDATGDTVPNLTRLQTFGSPDIGWVRVVVDTATGEVVRFEPRRFRGWW